MGNKKNIIIVIVILLFISLVIFFVSINKPHPTLSFNSHDMEIKVGETKKLDLIIENEGKYNIVWKSSNSNVVDVNDGIIKGLAKGNSIVTASIYEYNVEASIAITVDDILPTSIELEKKEITLLVGEKEKLNYMITPVNTTNNEVKWDVSDEKIVSINDGIVNAISPGSTMISVKTANGITDTCIIHVKNPEIPIEKIEFSSSSYSVYIDETISINPIISPFNATDKTLKWESSNDEIATVSNGVVKGIKKGNTIIKVSDNKGLVHNEINIVVLAREVIIPENEITIVGDSRMEGLCMYTWYKNGGGTCIAKTSMGYNWLNNTAISEVNKLSSNKKKNIVINLGVNDLGNINKYISKYQELAIGMWKDYHIFLLSVNPTNNKRADMNPRIETFNNKLKEGLNNYQNVTYCDSYNYLKTNGFETSDGVHYRQNTYKIIYEQIKKCIYNYYNE